MLTRRYGKYALVVGVATRAHDLRDRIDSALDPGSASVLNRALKEVASGDVRIRRRRQVEEPE